MAPRRLLFFTAFKACSAFPEETSLLQVKGAQVTQKGGDTVAGLMQSATEMLKNGATSDVVTFAEETLRGIQNEVYEAIYDGHNTDQKAINDVHDVITSNLVWLKKSNRVIAALIDGEIELNTLHFDCRKDEEKPACEAKRQCEQDFADRWQKVVTEEEHLEDDHKLLTAEKGVGSFCDPAQNATQSAFRSEAVALMTTWLEKKTAVEGAWAAYNAHSCDVAYADLEKYTASCDDAQLQLEAKSCELANKVAETRNDFARQWRKSVTAYQLEKATVQVKERDRQAEFKTLEVVKCLLQRTSEMNGKPCDSADQADQEVASCQLTNTDVEQFTAGTREAISLIIDYPLIPECPDECPAAKGRMSRSDVEGNHCLPVLPPLPCDDAYIGEYNSLRWNGPADWLHPQPSFTAGNPACNQWLRCTALPGTCQKKLIELSVPQGGLWCPGADFALPGQTFGENVKYEDEEVMDGWCKDWEHASVNNGGLGMPKVESEEECWAACRGTDACTQAVYEPDTGEFGHQCWLGTSVMSNPPKATRPSCADRENCVNRCYGKRGFAQPSD